MGLDSLTRSLERQGLDHIGVSTGCQSHLFSPGSDRNDDLQCPLQEPLDLAGLVGV